jgi:hypothetical protein
MDRVDAAAHREVAVYPDFSFGWYFLAGTEDTSDRAESELVARRKAEQLLDRDSVPDVVPQFVPSMRLYNSLMLATLQGDFAAAETLGRSSDDIPVIDGNVGREGMHAVTARALALGHDGSAPGPPDAGTRDSERGGLPCGAPGGDVRLGPGNFRQ